MEVNITEAAAALHVSEQTVRRRLHKGLIKGTKSETPQGFRWRVDLDQDQVTLPAKETTGAAIDLVVEVLQAQIASLEAQLTTRAREVDQLTRARDVAQLHQLLAARAINNRRGSRWWQFWR